MIRDLQNIINIPSVAVFEGGSQPFGENVAEVFSYMMNMAKADGFTTVDIDGYGGHIQYDRKIEKCDDQLGDTMGILCHLDVVPAGEDWDFEPFKSEIVDGKIYGRGAADDKGPTIASYYALKAIKELDIPLSKNVRIILGLDEETDWIGMDYYLSKEKAADFGFTPDGDFPVVNGEKGIMNFSIVKKIKQDKNGKFALRKAYGGNAPNMVADWAKATVLAKDKADYDTIKEIISRKREEGFEVSGRGVGKSFELSVKGVSAHGSTPEKGKNAISILMNVLGEMDIAGDDAASFVDFYNRHIAFDINGEKLNIGFEDELSGKTIVNAGVLEMDDKFIKIRMNVRYPVTCNYEDIYENMSQVLDNYDIGIVKEAHKSPIYKKADDPLIKTLMSVYKDITKDNDSEPKVIGGGTYARAMDNFVAYGGIFPGEPELAHQKNEYIKVDSLLAMSEIYAMAIYELCK